MYIGIDPGIVSGIAVLSDKHAVVHAGRCRCRCYRDAAQYVREQMQQYRGAIVAIEAPWVGINPQTVINLARCGAYWVAALEEHICARVGWQPGPTEWRHMLAWPRLKRDAAKARSIAFAAAMGSEQTDNNISDAICIAAALKAKCDMINVVEPCYT